MKYFSRYAISLLLFFSPYFIHAQSAFWKRHVVDSSFSGADGVKMADVNDDSLMDITTGWEEGGYTKVYLHPGYNLAKTKMAISDCCQNSLC